MTSSINRANKLSIESIEQYQEQGYLIIDDYFTQNEIGDLRAYIAAIIEPRSERSVFESDGRTLRSIYAIHQHSQDLARLSQQSLLVTAAQQLLGERTYVYQSKVNFKPAFASTAWDWHQDFTYWHYEDSMPTPRAVNMAVFVDEVNEFNGPLYLIPGSHRRGIQRFQSLQQLPAGYENSPAWISSLTAKLNYAIERQCIADLVKSHGIVSAKGKAGSILIFDSSLVHSSPPNITPAERTVLIFTYNRIDNAPPEAKRRRPEFLASADTRPIEAVGEVFSSAAAAGSPLKLGQEEGR
jgi:ectoine hydroxylase